MLTSTLRIQIDYAEYYYRRSQDSQIIMVTLKDSIVAEASMVYGVYAKGGASQAIESEHQDKAPITEIRSDMNSI